MPYQFTSEIQREIDAFAGDDPGQVAQETRIVRWLIQKAVEEGKYFLANSLCGTLAKLSATEIQNRIRVGQLIELSTLIRIAQQMSGAVARRISGLPGQETLTDELLADFTTIIQQERRQARPLLTHEGDTHDSDR
jgi:hypothetical protein